MHPSVTDKRSFPSELVDSVNVPLGLVESKFNSSSPVFQAVILSSDDFGRDLPGVEALLRKHDDLERDLTVIEGKMEALESEARRLARSQAHMVRAIQAKQTEIIENWERLNDLFDER